MEKIPWYQSQTLRALIIAGVAQVVNFLGLTDTVTTEVLTLKVDQLLDLASLIAVAWAAYARTTKANPPITNNAAKKEVVKQAELRADKQGGRISLLMLVSIAAIAGTMLLGTIGCASTAAAYKAAKGVDQQAFVALEHYDALLKEAVAFKANPNVPPDVNDAIKKADAVVYPLVVQVNSLRQSYASIKSAENEEALQTAVNDLVLKLSQLITAIKAGRSS